jgi:hypothetical protein
MFMFAALLPSPPIQAVAPALSARFSLMLQELRRVIAVRCAGRDAAITVARPLLILLWAQLNRTVARFNVLAARVAAGQLAAPRPRPAHDNASRPAPLSPLPSRARPMWPTGSGWLVRLVPEAACSAGGLHYLVTQPELAALLAAAPQAGRLLRPLCRLLGVKLPPALQLPRVPRATPPATEAAATTTATTALAAPRPAEATPAPRPPKRRGLAPFRPPRTFAPG